MSSTAVIPLYQCERGLMPSGLRKVGGTSCLVHAAARVKGHEAYPLASVVGCAS